MGDEDTAGEDTAGSLLVVRPETGPRFGDAPRARGLSVDFVAEAVVDVAEEEFADDGAPCLARPLLIGLSPEISLEEDVFAAVGEFAEGAGDDGELLLFFGDIAIIGIECTPAFSAYGS